MVLYYFCIYIVRTHVYKNEQIWNYNKISFWIIACKNVSHFTASEMNFWFRIKEVKQFQLQRDEVERVGDERELLKVRYICVTRLDITGHHLNSEGMGAWEEKYFVKGNFFYFSWENENGNTHLFAIYGIFVLSNIE